MDAAFAAVSSIGLLLLVAVVGCWSRTRRTGATWWCAIKLRALAQSVRTVWGNPGTRLGMWSHFSSQFSGHRRSRCLWGFPFLVRGQGWSEGRGQPLLMAMTAWAVVSGLVLARLVARLPYYRSWIVIGVVATMAAAWTGVLLWHGPGPRLAGGG